MDLIYEKASFNPAKLHEELAGVFGVKFVGISASRGQVRVHLMDDTPKDMQDQVGLIVAAHDAALLTAAQQAEVDQQAALDALRKPWDEWTAQDQSNFLRILAAQAGLIP
jgi:hypothetical protein